MVNGQNYKYETISEVKVELIKEKVNDAKRLTSEICHELLISNNEYRNIIFKEILNYILNNEV